MNIAYSLKLKGFTLIELLITVAIISILAATVVLVVNPVELLKQSRDAQRISELGSIDRALGIYQYESEDGAGFGAAKTVYVSLPGPSDCSGLGLPNLPSDWSYGCADASHYRNTDGSGWLPINFASAGGGLLGVLPVDPANTSTDGLYYTYVAGSWSLSATMESAKYAIQAANDNGYSSTRYEVGSDLNLDSSWIGYAYY